MKESRFFWWKMKKILDGPVFFGNKPRDQNYIRDWTCRIMVHIEPSSSRLLFLGRYSKRRHDDEKILQSVSNRVLIRSEATHAKSKRRHCVYVSGQHGYPLCTEPLDGPSRLSARCWCTYRVSVWQFAYAQHATIKELTDSEISR